MNLSATITIYAGGLGSGCNPDKGKCGRPHKGAPDPKIIGWLLPKHSVHFDEDTGVGVARHNESLGITGPALTPEDWGKIKATLRKRGYQEVGETSFGRVFWNGKRAARLEVRFLKRS